jgi:hypothetical protein
MMARDHAVAALSGKTNLACWGFPMQRNQICEYLSFLGAYK